MKLRLCFTLLMLCAVAHAQGSGFNSSQNTGFGAVGIAPSVQQNGLIKYHQLLWTISGTVTTCQVSLDTSPDNSTWTVGGAIAAQTCTSNGSSAITGIVSANYIRVNLSTLTGGGSVTIQYEGWAYNPSGGGGGSTCGTPTCTVSTAGSGNGVLALSGNTSGTATFTAPAVAGTTSNAVVSSNAFQLPSLGDATAGLNFAGSGGFFSSDTTNRFLMWGSVAQDWFGLKNSGPGVVMNGNAPLAWVSGNNIATGAVDSGVSRSGVGMVSVGNGALADETGLLRSANACRITADVSLTVNVANSFCSFSLPAIAKAWAWSCDIQWTITAGTGTNNFAVGVNASQTPTGTTNGEAQVYTATTGTQTMASAAISASGATNLLTGATYTPAATVQFAHTSGTLLASGTAGTFAITGTANGTTATAAVKAGTVCWLN